MHPSFLPRLRIKKLNPQAFLPIKGSDKAAGYDLFSIDKVMIPPYSKMLISTGLSMAVPEGNYARIAPRSGLAVKNFIDVGAGVVDSDYRGEVKVLLFNLGDKEFEVNYGDRIAQCIIEKYTPTILEEVEGELDVTDRGVGGFGSTGVNIEGNQTKENFIASQASSKKRKLNEEPGEG
mmetsp:Transcript_37957/g.36361  ORF Transcript_37957/g.36361 Transcript_37957/m.36361 type:complete len:178 (-) Transcript_37957:52-585(-)